MLLFNREDWRRHRPVALGCLGLALAAVAWYGMACLREKALLGGSSLVGLILGIAGALLVLFELGYGVRKYPIFRLLYRAGNARTLLRLHIWVGLLVVPLAALHSGFRFFTLPLALLQGEIGPLSSLAAVLSLVCLCVILSGVWGLAMQQVLPRILLYEVGEETVPPEVSALEAELLHEAEVLMRATCDPLPESGPGEARADGHVERAKERLALLRRHRDRLHARPEGHGPAGLPPRTLTATQVEGIQGHYLRSIRPFLKGGRSAPDEDDWRELARVGGPEGEGVVTALQKLCVRRRQLVHQRWLHGWLHLWLLVHASLSASLLVLLVWHAFASWVVYW